MSRVEKRKQEGWVPLFKNKNDFVGRPIYIKARSRDFFDELIKDHQKNYHLCSLLRSVNSLCSVASGYALNSAKNVKTLTLQQFSIKYYIHRGDILVDRVILDRIFQSTGGASGLYRTVYKKNKWVPSEITSPSMNTTHKWNTAHFAAISSGPKNLKKLRSDRLANVFPKAFNDDDGVRTKEMNKPSNHYSLYWINDKEHKQAKPIGEIAKLIEDNAQKGARVNWLVHGNAVKTFEESLKLIDKKPLIGVKESEFKNQHFVIFNPSSGNLDKIKKLCEDLELKHVASHINPRNHRSWKNNENVAKKLAKYTSFAVALGSPAKAASVMFGVSALEKYGNIAAENGISFLQSPTMTGLVVAGGAVAVMGYTLHSQLGGISGAPAAIAAMKHSTFGAGNDFWYTDDEDLLTQIWDEDEE